MPDEGKITLDFDFDDLTLLEAETIEEYSGRSLNDIITAATTGSVPIKVLTALVWVVQHRQDPAFTLDDAGKLKVTSLQFAGDGSSADEG